MVDLSLLKPIPFFQALTDAELRLIASLGEVHTFPKGAVLFKSGDRRKTFFVQLSGQVHIFRVFNEDVETLALLDRNEFSVETALVNPKEKHSHNGEMVEEGELLTIDGDRFSAFRKQHPDVANKLYAEMLTNLAERLHHVNNKLVTIYFTGKIASTYDDLGHLSDLLLDTILQIIRARRGAFVTFSPLEGKATIQEAKGYHNNQEMKNLEIVLNADPILGPVFHSGRDVIITEEQFKQERSLHTPYASRNMLVTPVKIRDKVVGAFLLGDKEGGKEFSHNNQILLNIIARQVALPIATAVTANES